MNPNSATCEFLTNSSWLKISLNAWLTDGTVLSARARTENKTLALVIHGEDELNFTQSDVRLLSVIIIEFSDVMDGRGFSLAAMLREKFNFTGTLHAMNILEDNIPFMQQCGFNSFQLETGDILDCDSHSEDQTLATPLALRPS